MRLIDADALRNALYEADAITMKGVAIINQFPTIDAVPVIRCKDCKNWHHSGYCRLLEMDYDRGPNDFCSYGERRGV